MHVLVGTTHVTVTDRRNANIWIAVGNYIHTVPTTIMYDVYTVHLGICSIYICTCLYVARHYPNYEHPSNIMDGIEVGCILYNHAMPIWGSGNRNNVNKKGRITVQKVTKE